MKNTMNAAEKINAQQAQSMTLSEMFAARLARNTVFSEALCELRGIVPGYTEVVQFPSEEEGYFDYVVRFPEDSEGSPIIVLRHTCFIQVYFEYKTYNFDLLDPNLDEAIECLPAECLCVNPYDILHDVADRISREIRYNDIMLARKKYRK